MFIYNISMTHRVIFKLEFIVDKSIIGAPKIQNNSFFQYCVKLTFLYCSLYGINFAIAKFVTLKLFASFFVPVLYIIGSWLLFYVALNIRS